MPKEELNHEKVKGMKPNGKPVDYFDTTEKGLILRLSKAGTKTFAYRYRFNGKNIRFRIGRFPKVSLSEARKRVRALREQVDDGIDPQAEKQQRKYKPKTITFRELAALFSKQHLPTLKKRTRDEYQRIIDIELLQTHKWGGLDATKITGQHVREVLNYKAYEEEAFTMANRMRSVISKTFEFGITVIGLDMVRNPVSSTAFFKQGENVRDRIYTEDEIIELWDFFSKRPEPMQSLFKMLLICGQRKTETMYMKWVDIEYDKPCKRIQIKEDGRPYPKEFLADVWTIRDTKSKRIHEIPLSSMALDILDKLKPITGNSDYVFASPVVDGQPITSTSTIVKSIKKNTSITDFWIHDIRRTVETKMEESGIDQFIAGKVLNHVGRESVTAKHYSWYDYMDKKQEALNRWNWRLESILFGEKETKIHKIG